MRILTFQVELRNRRFQLIFCIGILRILFSSSDIATLDTGGQTMKLHLTIAVISVLCLAVSSASATIFNLAATIDQSQEVPPTGSGGSGSATVTYNDVTGMLSWNISWSGLSGAATGMHFHGPAPVGTNAGVQVNIGGISGLTSPSVGSTSISAAQGNALVAGQWYINIHSAQFPGGEIRGQVTVPVAVEGTTWSRVKGLYGN